MTSFSGNQAVPALTFIFAFFAGLCFCDYAVAQRGSFMARIGVGVIGIHIKGEYRG